MKNVLWLVAGPVGDDTHGHIDDICRFVNPKTLVLIKETNRKDINYRPLAENWERIQDLRLEDGSKPEVVPLPMPAPLYFDGYRLPASYANFYISNAAVHRADVQRSERPRRAGHPGRVVQGPAGGGHPRRGPGAGLRHAALPDAAAAEVNCSQTTRPMAKYKKFEDLPVWQEAARLYNRVLDLLEEPNVPLTPGFRNQLDRAALSVSNNIAEGFERVITNELGAFLAIARGSAGEVRSMMAVVKDRPKLMPFVRRLQELRALADSAARQLTAWTVSMEGSPVQGKRHLTPSMKTDRVVAQKAQAFRLNFLRGLKPEHPLYNSLDARAARGEPVEE